MLEMLSQPHAQDVPVRSIFGEQMWADLRGEMLSRGWAGVNETDAVWTSDLSNRKIFSEFLMDAELADKRLAYMPDKYTNAIHTSDGDVRVGEDHLAGVSQPVGDS